MVIVGKKAPEVARLVQSVYRRSPRDLDYSGVIEAPTVAPSVCR